MVLRYKQNKLMDNFEPIPLPPLPRYKVKPSPAKELPAAAPSEAELDPEEQLQKMLDEEYPPIVDEPPQCEWHLGPMMSAIYPDPFTLPAVHYAQQSIIHDIAATAEAIVAAGREAIESESSSKDESKSK
jgi:hypothetical protein